MDKENLTVREVAEAWDNDELAVLLAEKSGKPKDIQWCIANDTKGYPIVVISNKPDKEGHVWVLRERDQEYFLDCQRIWELTFSGARMKPVEENVESDQRGTGDK